MPELVSTGVRDLLVSSDIPLDAKSFFRILSTHFPWLTAKFEVPSLFR